MATVSGPGARPENGQGAPQVGWHQKIHALWL
jgi:hypothetical protein